MRLRYCHLLRRLLRKQPQEFAFERGKRYLPHCLPRIDQQIPTARKVHSIQPKHFAHPPSQAIAAYSIPQTHWRGDA
jgi:hypothetical protein